MAGNRAVPHELLPASSLREKQVRRLAPDDTLIETIAQTAARTEAQPAEFESLEKQTLDDDDRRAPMSFRIGGSDATPLIVRS